jgi:hypothetical protein
MTYHEFARSYPEHREELEERAAIMEFSGGREREDAEKRAVMRLRIKYDLLWGQLELIGGDNDPR